MKQAAKATALVLAVSLLSGCSNSGVEKAIVCQTAKDDSRFYYDDYETNKELLRAQIFKNLSETGTMENYQSKEFEQEMKENYYNSQLIIVNNPSCFLPSEVTEAQENIERVSE
jgi:uncharacterized lipoprotein